MNFCNIHFFYIVYGYFLRYGPDDDTKEYIVRVIYYKWLVEQYDSHRIKLGLPFFVVSILSGMLQSIWFVYAANRVRMNKVCVHHVQI